MELNLEEVEIIDIETIKCGDEYVYNLEIEDNHNYFADDILVSNCHCLRGPACSALLKILEEPPAHSMFILATTDPQKVLPTIHSRCQRFQLKKLKQSEIINHLRNICEKEGIDGVEDKALQAIARASGGSIRDALSNLDAVIGRCGSDIKEKDALDILGMAEQKRIFDLLKSICNHDYKKSILITNLLVNGEGKDPKEVFINLLEFTNDMLISKSIESHEHLFIEDCILKEWIEIRDTIDFSKLVLIVRIISSYMKDLTYMPRPDLVLNTCIVHLLENTFKK